MAMGTTEHPKDNPQMHAPVREQARAAVEAKADDVGVSVLSDDDDKVDWVMLMRLYPHARSKDELRDLATKAGAAAMENAAKAIANKDVPLPRPDEPGGMQ